MAGEGGRRWARIFRPDARGEIEEELSFHLEQRVRDNIAQGMDADAARAAAERRLGDLGTVQRECAELLMAERRSEARREWLRFSVLDFRLGVRMLRKYPGLTIVAGTAIAFAIAIGAVAFEFLMQVTRPSLPVPDGDRLVAVRVWDAARSSEENRILYDFGRWRVELSTMDGLGAYRSIAHNLTGADGDAVAVTAAHITASGLRLAGVAPLLGRPLIDADQDPRAPAVVVIGERVWRNRFGSDRDVIGRTVEVDGEAHRIIGVMPRRFGFPLHHEAWIPLTLDAAAHEPLEGPSVTVFGRLAAGSTLEQAQAELSAVAARTRQDSPRTHEHLDARVLPYTESWVEPDALFLAYFGNSFMVLFLLLIYANVALLMFGRAATRESEIVVRNALGASRARVLMQLFTETLVLGALGAVVGIAFARLGMGWIFWFIEENGVDLPFWFRQGLSPLTALYAAGLTVLAAVVAGVLPALKVTRGLGTRLRAASAGGGGPRFGLGWTAVIVAQVAFTAAFFPLLIGVGAHAHSSRMFEVGVPAEEYLTAELLFRVEPPDLAGGARSAEAIALDLKRRLAAEPGVRAVTFARQLPGSHHPDATIEVEGLPLVSAAGARLLVRRGTVDSDYFPAMGAPVRVGRTFHPGDIGSDAQVVIVNESFVRDVLSGRNPIGRRVRYFETTTGGAEQPGPWQEIIGVVADLAMSVDPDVQSAAGVYHPLSLNGATVVRMAVHLDTDPVAFGPRLRTLAAAVDPALRLDEVRPLDDVVRSYLDAITAVLRIMIAAGVVALVLALAGIYSMMSFTVTRRTREIGIRVALGSGRLRVITTMFSRALVQVTLGIAIGLGAFLTLLHGSFEEPSSLRWWDNVALIVAYATILAGVCLLACVVPARRALAVQPTEALKADA